MEAYIYDAVRTPRGRGKKDGGLHGTTPLELAAAAKLCPVYPWARMAKPGR